MGMMSSKDLAFADVSWLEMTPNQRIEQVQKAWYPGCSAKDIAIELSSKFGTISRNAVIGYYTRYKSALFYHPINIPTRDVNRQKQRRNRVKLIQPPKLDVTQEADQFTSIFPEISFKLTNARADVQNVTLLDLGHGECRWPVNDAKPGEVHLFCGCGAVAGRPYCEAHDKLSSAAKARLAAERALGYTGTEREANQ